MTNKTISINPSLFSTGGSKTKKNKDKKQKAVITPLISPNVLKNKLLKRIKEHKQRETENLENNKKGGKSAEPPTLSIPTTTTTSSFSDEFSDSLNYLQTLTEDKKQKENKVNSEIMERRRKEKLERSTVKNYQSMGGDHQGINIDLPEELSHPLMRINTELLSASGAPVVIKDNVPYGILKGGQKPTYKDWRQTQRNNIVTNPNLALTIEGANINREKNERENRLSILREKLKQKQVDELIQKDRDVMMSQNLIHNNNNVVVAQPTNVTAGTGAVPISEVMPAPAPISVQMPSQNLAPNERIIATKRITKKTIKRKYTLGKSKLRKTVAVLIKDRGTRKKVLAAQKDLKRKSINDIKTYLRDHNLIKIGSNAPNEVIRKLYESAMLAGEIMNSNADTLLHNFSKNEKEL
jgi:hypothetical protein